MQIPEGWETKLFTSFSSKIQSGGTPKSDNPNFYNGNIPFVAIDDLTSTNKYLLKTKKKITAQGLANSAAWEVPVNSLMYSIYATLGVPRINKIVAATNQAILNVIPNENVIDLEFLFYLLLEKRTSILAHSAHTTQSNLNAKIVKELEFTLPKSTTEQKKIAEILSKVDTAIEQTQSLIAKYQRIKTGLMQDLLTKGIDENGNIRSEETHEFKDSELGMIPKDWEVDKLETICITDITYGIVQAGPNIENGIPYIRTGDMSGDALKLSGLMRTTPEIASKFKRSTVREGEIVFALRATIGKVLLVPSELDGANLTQGTARISSDEDVVKNNFLIWCLRMDYFKNQILQNQKGTTFSEISLGQLRKMKVSFPKDTIEQDKIINILEEQVCLIYDEQQKLQKLQSIKTGLMQDLLSGKKRVTNLIKEKAL